MGLSARLLLQKVRVFFSMFRHHLSDLTPFIPYRPCSHEDAQSTAAANSQEGDSETHGDIHQKSGRP